MWFGPFPVVNSPVNIAKNDNMISINTAMSIDLFGQVAAEGMAGNQFSGTGGQGDYVRGAQLAKGGKSFLAFKSTLGKNKDGSPVSRIVPSFPPGHHRHHPPVRRPVCGDGVRLGQSQASHRPGPGPGPHRPGPPGLPGRAHRPSEEAGPAVSKLTP